MNPVTTHTIQSMHVFDDPHACVSGSGHVSKLSVQINEDAPVIAAAMPALARAARQFRIRQVVTACHIYRTMGDMS